MSLPPPRPPFESESGVPIPLDGLVYGVDLLDALLVVHLGDAHLFASWVRPESGILAEDLVVNLRDAFRSAQLLSRRVMAERRPEPPPLVMTLELPARVAVLRRVRAHLVASIFDAQMPLGMARLLASRFAFALEPEMPLAGEPGAPSEPSLMAPQKPRISTPAGGGATRSSNRWSEPAPNTVSFGVPPAHRPAAGQRTEKLLQYLEAHAPEPHVVRYRLALRAGLTLAALDRPDALGPEAIVLIETAVQDILGIDRAELRRIA